MLIERLCLRNKGEKSWGGGGGIQYPLLASTSVHTELYTQPHTQMHTQTYENMTYAQRHATESQICGLKNKVYFKWLL